MDSLASINQPTGRLINFFDTWRILTGLDYWPIRDPAEVVENRALLFSSKVHPGDGRRTMGRRRSPCDPISETTANPIRLPCHRNPHPPTA